MLSQFRCTRESAVLFTSSTPEGVDVAIFKHLARAISLRSCIGTRRLCAGAAHRLVEAVYAHTLGAAYASRADDRVGSLRVGKLAYEGN